MVVSRQLLFDLLHETLLLVRPRCMRPRRRRRRRRRHVPSLLLLVLVAAWELLLYLLLDALLLPAPTLPVVLGGLPSSNDISQNATNNNLQPMKTCSMDDG